MGARGAERKWNPLTPLSGFRCSQSGEWVWMKKEVGGVGVVGGGGGVGGGAPAEIKKHKTHQAASKINSSFQPISPDKILQNKEEPSLGRAARRLI